MLNLTEEQNSALEKIKAALAASAFEKILLYGVTGSGKTEVYMRAMAECVNAGKTGVILVPEIVLTPQIIERYQSRFANQLAVIHSDKTVKQRNAEWQRIYSGEAKVVFGTRSALFAPFKNLGLIVMDEEFETSYKSDMSPRYHARQTAEKLAEISNAVLVFGSATPSIETFYSAKTGSCQFAKLSKRIDNRPLPPVEVVDMRKEKNILSAKLTEALKQTLIKKEKAVLFLNRRGYFRVSFCERCGEAVKCPNCSVPLIFHSPEIILECGHCEYKTSANIACPKCGNINLSRYGIGTQRIEAEVGRIFRDAKIVRLDRDAAKTRGAMEAGLAAFTEGSANILIGTQLASKGMDVTAVTLAAIINADVGLNIPDFRAAEHAFQCITQTAGRAGRHHLPGRVIIQTYNPEHYAIKFAAEHDYDGFYDEEIKYREELFYPPFSKLISLEIQGKTLKDSANTAALCRKILDHVSPGITVLGPAKAPIEKLRGRFRHLLLLKGEDQKALRRSVDSVMEKVILLNGARIIVDVDPVNFL